MDFTLSDEQKMLIETIRTMGQREKFRDLAKHIDATGEFPYHLLEMFGKLGFLGMTLSVEHGGGGQPAMNAVLCIEE
ncbi:MAG TPA: acyl-CoA dehydrogenase family protein, partial [Spirochaetota bacterium]|nr:acyl-CoA dehydrogenase family protein [Spirochaetota bacterium]